STKLALKVVVRATTGAECSITVVFLRYRRCARLKSRAATPAALPQKGNPLTAAGTLPADRPIHSRSRTRLLLLDRGQVLRQVMDAQLHLRRIMPHLQEHGPPDRHIFVPVRCGHGIALDDLGNVGIRKSATIFRGKLREVGWCYLQRRRC